MPGLYGKVDSGIPTTRALIDRLKMGNILSRIGGWRFAAYVPYESAFSRIFAHLAQPHLPGRIHHELTTRHFESEIFENTSVNASAIKAWERAVPNPPKVPPLPK